MTALKNILFTLLLFAGAQASAQVFLAPNFGVGYNGVQGTYYRLGLDLGYHIDENVYAGVGGYYAVGNHPNDDREIGGGPFVGVSYPVVSIVSVQLREDVDYVDERDPVLNAGNPNYYTHYSLFGVESSTYGGVHLAFTHNLGLSVGYRVVIGLTNFALANSRSGAVFGLTLGF